MKIMTIMVFISILCASCSVGGEPQSTWELDDINKFELNKTNTKNGVVNVYSARHYAADTVLFDAFTQQTGISVNEIKGTPEELVERMMEDGESSDADLFFTVDGGVLSYAKRYEVLQPLRTKAIDDNVPSKWRDPDNYWIGITTRARVIVYAKDRVKPEELSTCEGLTDESFITLNGEASAEQWAYGIVRNFARIPEGGDREQAQAIADGVGDVAIMNTYYVGQLSASKDSEEALMTARLGVFFPNQQTVGTHINISGIGLARYAKNEENAVKLVEFMTSEDGQTLLAHESFEYPVNEKATVPELLKSWGAFNSQKLDFVELANARQAAIDIFKRVDWP